MNSPVEGEDPTRPKRQGAEQAIQLALESKWEEAATLNRSILAATSTDVDAWNRLGKSLLELGRYKESYEAYAQSLALDPVNQIAKRNLDRLEGLQDAEAPRTPPPAGRVAQDLFIEEVGKTGVTVLQNTPPELMPTLTAGDEVYLRTGDDLLRVETAADEYIGSVEPKLGLRLLRLIEGGNQYAAAVKSVGDKDVELIIKETFRHPSQTRLSFPATGGDTVRPYIKESLLRLGDDDEMELMEDDGDTEEFEAEPDAEEGTVSFSSFTESDGDDEDDEG
jgi:tetratricopeptide (TPR) repeat protein